MATNMFEQNVEDWKIAKRIPTFNDCAKFYEELIFDDDLKDEEKNKLILRLKDVCLSFGIDHSRFNLFEVKSKSSQEISSSEEFVEIEVAVEQELVEIKAVINQSTKAVDKLITQFDNSFPFLSKVILQINENNTTAEEKIVIVHGKSLNEYTSFGNIVHDKKISIDKLDDEKFDSKFCWIVMLAFHSIDEDVRSVIDKMFKKFTSCRVLDLYDFKNKEDYYWKKNSTQALAHVFSENPCILVHDNINSEYECLIKSFFGSSSPFLVYKKLKGGFSGSEVLLVSPKGGFGEQKKFVIKISNKEDKESKKLIIENKNYKDYVEPYSIPGQFISAEWKETLNFFAIKYPFASSDSITDSISLTAFYSKSKNSEELRSVLTRIFDHNLHKKWRENVSSRKNTFINSFKQNLKWDETEQTFKSILELNPSIDINIEKITNILNSDHEFFVCVNHGDLHSDNIQVQEESVYLIDFGLTGTYPCGMDYAMLEASIRFKLLDYSIGSDYLLKEHIPFLNDFDSKMTLEKSFKNDSDKAIKSCSVIRQSFLNHFSFCAEIRDLKKQYLHCLLFICMRQLNYKELNRKYMLLTIKKIIEELNLNSEK